MSWKYSRYRSVSGPAFPASKTREKPITALSSVRNSWLMLARNCDFARLAIMGGVGSLLASTLTHDTQVPVSILMLAISFGASPRSD